MKLLYLAAATASFALISPAMAATITNGTIQLGVDTRGQLNASGVGVKDLRTGREAIFPGCPCEGWGAADAANGTTGYANNSTGIANATVISFGNTASTATSVVGIAGASPMEVTHIFAPTVVGDLFVVDVEIKNVGALAITDLRYRRVMDWDVEPTAFNEYVTIQGVGATALLFSSDNGFANANPLSAGGFLLGGTTNVNFTDSGPSDHGALFDFGFGSLAAGASKKFQIFYGASLTEAGALAALGTVGAEVYSLGQSSGDINGGTPGYSTFIFGFKGVGGVPVPPPSGAVPEPATWAMMIFGFGVVGSAMRRRRQTVRVSFV